MTSITVEPASPEIIEIIDRWHRFMRGDTPDALDRLLHDDVVLYSPVVHTPQRGKTIVAKYLKAARATFAAIGFDADTGPSFRYVKHIVSGDTGVFQFETEMGGKHVNGVDIIRVDGAGTIVEFRVMVRPLQALNAVHELMGAELAAIDAAQENAPS
jgi:ketosteroid isomerase-like protein